MFQHEIEQLFEQQIVLTNQEIQSRLGIGKQQCATFNVEMKRLCDRELIKRIGRGVYTKLSSTKWGRVAPTELEIAECFYMVDDNGYLSGTSYYNSIGISTLVPNHLEITSNRYNYKFGEMVHTKVLKPREVITKENKQYLQLLDGIYWLAKNHCDAANPTECFAQQLQRLQLNEVRLILMAKRLYPHFVLDRLLEVEDLFHDEFAFAD
ncbi:MAG: hypothetical protein ACI4A3_02060 [Lachnospiraceae bacterium]